MLLINPEIKFQSNKYVLINKKSKKLFIIPAILVKYVNNDTLSIKIKIKVDRENIKFNIDDIINIHVDCCRLIDDFGFIYYLNLNGQKVNFDAIKKIVLLEE